MGKMYKVVKDIPFLSKNQIIESSEGYLVAEDDGRPVHSYPIFPLLNGGWIEELDEKKEALEEKLGGMTCPTMGGSYSLDYFADVNEISQIAKAHFQSHPEELGLVRIEDVLKIIEMWMVSSLERPKIEHLISAIERMKGEGK